MTDELKEFLSFKDIKEALNKNDLKYCFDTLSKNNQYYHLIKEFNELLMKSKINPLNYIDRIYPHQFNTSKIENITISKNIKIIDAYAFVGCSRLKNVIIPNSVKYISDGAFYDCTGLTSVTIGNSVESIGDNAFCGCTGLTSVTIPDGVTSIGDRAFCYCAGLTSVTIPDSVISIGINAFYYCAKLEDVTITERFKDILPEIFGDNHSSINFKFI